MRLKRLICVLLTLALLNCCLITPAAAEYRELKQGDVNEDVKKLKEAMYYLGYFTSLNVSEKYNNVMMERVKNLQRVNGLEETGIADPALQELVFSGKALPTEGAPAPTEIPPATPTPEPTPVPTPSPIPTPTPDLSEVAAGYQALQLGDSSPAVKKLKTAMYYLGYFATLNLSDKYNDVMVERVKLLQGRCGLEETGIADGYLQALVFSGNATPAENAPKPTAIPTPVPTPIGPKIVPEDLPQSTGENNFLLPGEEDYVYANEDDGLWIYRSASLSVEIRRYTDKVSKLVWFETEVFTSDETPLTSYLSPSKTPGRRYMNPLDLAWNNHVVLGITDDFFGNRWLNNQTVGIVIRNGNIISDKTFPADRERFPNLEVVALFDDGSLRVYESDEYTAQEYLDMGVTDTFAFGPILVQNGKLGQHMEDDDYYRFREPRMAIGMIEPHHYIILTVNGRTDDSKGVYLPWLAEKMLEKGVTEAINLDGGGTVALMFMGDVINKSTNNLRSVTSIIGFGQSDEVYKK